MQMYNYWWLFQVMKLIKQIYIINKWESSTHDICANNADFPPDFFFTACLVLFSSIWKKKM